jgi:hypothetical protein
MVINEEGERRGVKERARGESITQPKPTTNTTTTTTTTNSTTKRKEYQISFFFSI